MNNFNRNHRNLELLLMVFFLLFAFLFTRKSFADDVTHHENPQSVFMGQVEDLGNSVEITSANASPGSPWIGEWKQTRAEGIVNQLSVVSSNVPTGLGGTFTFEYSDDGIVHNGISEPGDITDFATVRDFPLRNAGRFYRVKFEPDRILTSGEKVFIVTQHGRQFEGPFVRRAGQELEEANAAMAQAFAYGKAFDQVTGKSVNLRPFNSIHTATQCPTSLGANEEFIGSTWIDSIQSGYYLYLIAGTSPFTTVQIQWSDDGINPNGSVTNLTNKPVVAGSLTYNVYLTITGTFISGRYWRARVVNGATPQSAPVLVALSASSVQPYQPLVGLTDNLSFISSAILGRNIIAARTRTGDFLNINATKENALYVKDKEQTVTESGSLFTESIRDDITLNFSRSSGSAAISHLVNNLSVNGSVAHDLVEGQAVFSVSGSAGSRVFYTSDKKAVYETGHMIRGGQTIEISAIPTGSGKIEWGFGEDNPSSPNGDVYNGIGHGLDATGLYTFRKKNGSYASKVYQTNWNRDKVNGGEFSDFKVNGASAALNILKNLIFEVGYEWYGIAPPKFFVAAPYGLPIETHVEETVGQQNGTTVPDPKLPMFIRIENDATTGQVLSVRTGSWRGGVFTSKAASIGKNPDGDFIDNPAPGQVSYFSSTSNLTASGSFAPTIAQPTDGWKSISVSVFASHVSANNGIVFEFFSDDLGTQSLGTTSFTYDTPNVRRTYEMSLVGRSYKVSYLNGGTGTTTLRFFTQLNTTGQTGSVTTVETPITGTTSGQVVKAIPIGRKPDGSYGNVQTTNNNSLQVAIIERTSAYTGRTYLRGQATAATATNTTLHTVTGGKTFYLEGFIITGVNSSGTVGQVLILDNATTRIPFVFPAQGLGSTATQFSESFNFTNEPMPFTTSLVLNEAAGTLTMSIMWYGYEE